MAAEMEQDRVSRSGCLGQRSPRLRVRERPSSERASSQPDEDEQSRDGQECADDGEQYAAGVTGNPGRRYVLAVNSERHDMTSPHLGGS